MRVRFERVRSTQEFVLHFCVLRFSAGCQVASTFRHNVNVCGMTHRSQRWNGHVVVGSTLICWNTNMQTLRTRLRVQAYFPILVTSLPPPSTVTKYAALWCRRRRRCCRAAAAWWRWQSFWATMCGVCAWLYQWLGVYGMYGQFGRPTVVYKKQGVGVKTVDVNDTSEISSLQQLFSLTFAVWHLN